MVKAQKNQETLLHHVNAEETSVLQTSKTLEGSKILYILVQDDPEPEAKEGEQGSCHRYTRPLLTSTLQLMGCKLRHAIKISDRVFEVIKSEMPPSKPKRDRFVGLAPLADIGTQETKEYDSNGFKVNPKPQKKRSTVTVSRDKFLNVVCEALAQYQYLGPKQRTDLMVACRIRERKESFTVLLCGTSGCGKSTLASLLGHRLGVTTVVSTDSVRHMMRGFVSEQENPLLWSSTYHAGEFLDQEAVSEAYYRKKEGKQGTLHICTPSTGSLSPTDSGSLTELDLKNVVSNGIGSGSNDNVSISNGHVSTSNGNGYSSNGNGFNNNENGYCSNGKGKSVPAEEIPTLKSSSSGNLENGECLVSAKVMAIQGFKAQSEMVMDSLDRLITGWEGRKESVVVEGVHLSLNFVMGLMKKHPSIIPFMIYIANEDKHLERFAVRAKYMTLDPTKNKYVKYIRNIRTIQDYLCKRADKHLVPKINNTNVDKSVAAIHATVFNCLRKREDGEGLLDLNTNTVKVVHHEYMKQYTSSALGSKSMFQLIQRKGSSRNLLAVMNDDGSVNKAWPILPVESEKKLEASSVFEHKVVGTTLYGPLSVGSSEPVRLQFGNLDLSDWQNDKGTSSEVGSSAHNSYAGESVLRNGDLFRLASAGSSGRKEPKEEVEVLGSDEELEEENEAALREGETSGSELEHLEENDLEGSVDDGSGRSEGEDDFVAKDEDDAFWEVEETSPAPKTSPAVVSKDKNAHMLRLRSFDKAATGRVGPVLRKSASHKTRSSTKRHSPKAKSIQACFASTSP